MSAPQAPDYDPSVPFSGSRLRWETYVQHRLAGKSQTESMRLTYPTRRPAPSNKWPAASKMEAKVKPRLQHLMSQATTDKVMSIAERKEILTQAIRDAAQGLKPYMKALPDGELSFDIDEDNITQAIESIEQHIRLGGEGGGPDTVIRKIKIRDFVSYLDILNKMEGVYKPEGTTGGITVINDLIMPGDLDRRRNRKRKKKFDKSAQT